MPTKHISKIYSQRGSRGWGVPALKATAPPLGLDAKPPRLATLPVKLEAVTVDVAKP